MSQKKIVYCPVGNHIELGYLTKGESSTFICRECQFVFTWDKTGKILPPVKLNTRKPQVCDCGLCQTRREYQPLPLLLPWKKEESD